MRLRPLLFSALAAALALAVPGKAAGDVAFGYLLNRSGNANYDYLETIFPNSFASSLASQYMMTVLRPASVDERFRKRGMELKKLY